MCIGTNKLIESTHAGVTVLGSLRQRMRHFTPNNSYKSVAISTLRQAHFKPFLTWQHGVVESTKFIVLIRLSLKQSSLIEKHNQYLFASFLINQEYYKRFQTNEQEKLNSYSNMQNNYSKSQGKSAPCWKKQCLFPQKKMKKYTVRTFFYPDCTQSRFSAVQIRWKSKFNMVFLTF